MGFNSKSWSNDLHDLGYPHDLRKLHPHIYICMYVCMYVFIYLFIYIFFYLFIYINIYIYICIIYMCIFYVWRSSIPLFVFQYPSFCFPISKSVCLKIRYLKIQSFIIMFPFIEDYLSGLFWGRPHFQTHPNHIKLVIYPINIPLKAHSIQVNPIKIPLTSH